MVEKTDARLVILPETAFPIFLHQLEPEYLAALADRIAQRGGDMVFGIAIADVGPRAYYNAVVSAGASPPQLYRKQHLVPFGEYLPLRFVFAWVLDVLHMPMADFDTRPGQPAADRRRGPAPRRQHLLRRRVRQRDARAASGGHGARQRQ